jgi:hypothetical protein
MKLVERGDIQSRIWVKLERLSDTMPFVPLDLQLLEGTRVQVEPDRIDKVLAAGLLFVCYAGERTNSIVR